MQAAQLVFEALQNKNITVFQNEPLQLHTSFKIGGPALLFCVPNTQEELLECLRVFRKFNLRYLFLGEGTNVLFRDEGFKGAILQLGKQWQEIAIHGNTIAAGAAASLSDVCKAARDASLEGIEFAYGIPGRVGGAVYMNAGAYGGEMKDILQNITYLDENLQVKTAPAEEFSLGYRTSAFQHNPWCILQVEILLKQGSKEEISLRMQELMERRRSKQPLEYPSGGSAFKRPEGAYAGALIDQCGLRGYRVNDAAISEKHCGFIVNLGSASCKDVLQLAAEVAAKVEKETGFILEKEIRVIE